MARNGAKKEDETRSGIRADAVGCRTRATRDRNESDDIARYRTLARAKKHPFPSALSGVIIALTLSRGSS